MTFLVTGATGNVGSELARLLADRGLPVRGVSRRPPAEVALGVGVDSVHADLLSAQTMAPAFAGVQAAFLLASGNERELLEIAARQGVNRIVLLSTIAVQSRPDSSIGRDHRHCEQAVTDTAAEWTILRPTHFASNAKEWAPQIRSGSQVTGRQPDTALPVVSPTDIAAVAAEAMTAASYSQQYLHLTGPYAITARARLATIGRVIGKTLRYVKTMADIEPHLHEISNIRDNPLPLEVVVTDTVRDVTGTTPESFEAWVRSHADTFR
ncbi:MAG: nucleoside-diphosphate sugar epimerase [Nocardia sp.]|uniref:SDR family oxidoreductase n=1 Tax=Nocardia sp. TaxID=1821 RepID=UPI00262D7B9D|nr:NAD(P)H-binding protein [Nocardia sp.]MCU1643925.1 nucleoside-diphosphate sugar epimerase [Nocardia sp.]